MDRLQWGNRKRLRCVKFKETASAEKSNGSAKNKITSRRVFTTAAGDANFNRDSNLLPQFQSPNRVNRDSGKTSTSSSPEKEDRYYTTRGSVVGLDDSNVKLLMDPKEENKKFVWPKLMVSLSSKEKEEDFMAMKGCKLPQRPKKRAKLIQRSLLLVSPGAWLSDLCQERYEVREKKTSKKVQKPRGLKAMGGMESESE